MNRLEIYMPPAKLVARLIVIVAIMFFAVCVAFWIDPLGLNLQHDFAEEHVPFLRAFGTLVVLMGSFGTASVLDALIWPKPVVTADENGVTLRNAFVPWEDFRDVQVHTMRVNFVPVQRHVDVLTHSRHGLRRRRRLESNWVPGKAKDVAMQIGAYAEMIATVRSMPAAATPVRPQRPARLETLGMRPGFT